MRILRTCACLALVLAWHAPALHGQMRPPPVSHRPALQWQTLRTEHFDVHHPAELAPWAQAVAARLDAARAAVVPHVGHTPARTHVVVDEVGHVSGGFAWAVTFDLPLVLLWPDQQMPVLGLTQRRPDVLAVHELAHIAHLGRPSRSRWGRVWPRLVPPSWELSPILLGSPGWVVEGYATYTEGRLTGAGTPFSVLRAALLRQWALEGRLPSYGELNGGRGFLGSRVPYGVGSAYFEWLAERVGDEAIRRLWSRMAAADRPGFAAAFTEVFGERPDQLYARFAADVTARAGEARDSLAAAGLVEGETVQRLEQLTGAPAISPDGRYMALTLRGRGQPPRLVVWDLAEPALPPGGTAEGAARRTGADGSAPMGQPQPPPQVAALHPVGVRPYEEPRFLPDGRSVVATRREPTPDGTLRSDLFVWDWRRGTVRRVTRGAGIHTADPSPDGRTAVADRCLGGTCDLVLVDLESGGVRVLAPGGPFLAWSRPRWAPDGRSIVAARNDGGRWRVVLLDGTGARARAIDPDDGVSRYAPAFTRDGGGVVAVSERGGIHTVVHLDPSTRRESALTRVTGGAVAPAPHPSGDLYFLRLHAGGLDLARLRREAIRPLPFVSLPPRLAPAVPPARHAVDSLAVAAVPAPRPYGAGPRRFGILPTGGYSPAGRSLGLAITNTDPVGRLTLLLQGALAENGGWEGAALGATWRGSRPTVTAELFAARQAGAGPAPTLSQALRGGAVILSLDHAGRFGHRVRAGGSLAALGGEDDATDGRLLGFVEGRVRLGTPGMRGAQAELSGHLGVGTTRDSSWQRAVGVLDARVRGGAHGLDARLTYGTVGGDAPAYERFASAGAEPSLLDPSLLSQQVALPFFPAGTLAGRRFAASRIALTGWPLEPFVWSGSAGEALERWQHVVGIERTLTAPHVPYMRLPGGVQGRVGLGYSMNAPVPDRLRGWITLSLRP